MNQLALILIGSLTSLCASFAFAVMPAPPLDLRSADWSLKQAKILNAQSKDAVWHAMLMLWNTSDDVSTDAGEVCEFQFVDLRHSGQLSLVVSDDGGGTVDCNDVDIFDKTTAGIEDYSFETGMSYFDSIEDINGDGHYELIVDEDFASGGQTDHCLAMWPVVYAWTSNGYSGVSSHYKSFYKQQLASLQKQIAAAEGQTEHTENRSAIQGIRPAAIAASGALPGQQPADHGSPRLPRKAEYLGVTVPQPLASPSPDTGDLDCSKAEAAKIERFLGISRDAGTTDAIKWANSDDTHNRYFAKSILFDIGTPEAARYLRTLSNDPDRNIAMSAKNALMSVSNKRPAVFPTIQGELLTQVTGASAPK